MTSGDLPGVTVLGRPIKPVALGMSVLMVTLVAINLLDVGELHGTALGDVVALLAGVSAVALWVGWLGRVQAMAEFGLLAAAIVYTVRSAFILLSQGLASIGVWLGLGAAVIAGGAFLLESWDDQREDA